MEGAAAAVEDGAGEDADPVPEPEPEVPSKPEPEVEFDDGELLEGWQALGQFLSSSKAVTQVDLRGMGMGPRGAMAFAGAKPFGGVLATVLLSDNRVGGYAEGADEVEGIKALAAALKGNKILQVLEMERCHVGPMGIAAFKEATINNEALSAIFEPAPPPDPEHVPEPAESISDAAAASADSLDDPALPPANGSSDTALPPAQGSDCAAPADQPTLATEGRTD